jgi:hypothetical protein
MTITVFPVATRHSPRNNPTAWVTWAAWANRTSSANITSTWLTNNRADWGNRTYGANRGVWMIDNRDAWMTNNGIVWMTKNRTVWMPINRTTPTVVPMAVTVTLGRRYRDHQYGHLAYYDPSRLGEQ